mmetsp:Transcript_30836/g.60734  ORF Transcript_30836/g.60734 Transcript_30836/m.60734 type:complete len:89 (-) Transcript_30836:494-760(-)
MQSHEKSEFVQDIESDETAVAFSAKRRSSVSGSSGALTTPCLVSTFLHRSHAQQKNMQNWSPSFATAKTQSKDRRGLGPTRRPVPKRK